MCNLYSITTNQAAIAALFRIVNRYAGNLLPLPGVFPDYQAPIVLNGADGTRTRGGAMGHAVGRPRAQYLLIYSPPSSKIEWLIALHGDSQPVAAVREVVEQRMVLR